jgi:hypothetical protein
LHFTDFCPTFAVMVAFPALIPFTLPFDVTVAIFLSEDDQVTFEFL